MFTSRAVVYVVDPVSRGWVASAVTGFTRLDIHLLRLSSLPPSTSLLFYSLCVHLCSFSFSLTTIRYICTLRYRCRTCYWKKSGRSKQGMHQGREEGTQGGRRQEAYNNNTIHRLSSIRTSPKTHFILRPETPSISGLTLGERIIIVFNPLFLFISLLFFDCLQIWVKL